MKLEHEIAWEDPHLTVGGAPVLRVMEPGEFPCRDEEKSDPEHAEELEDLAAEVARLAEAARGAERQAALADEVSPWIPMTNLVDLKHLGKLAEELNEAGAAVARCVIQGMDGAEPRTGKVNRQWLEEELADVFANASLVMERFNLNADAIHKRRAHKIGRLRAWHAMGEGA